MNAACFCRLPRRLFPFLTVRRGQAEGQAPLADAELHAACGGVCVQLTALCGVLRGIGGGCDQEAVRVIKSMPAWKAGKQNGQPVKVYFTLPVKFKLE